MTGDSADHADEVGYNKGCGCLGCLDDAVAVIDHPDHGERTVCEGHINCHPVKRRFARV